MCKVYFYKHFPTDYRHILSNIPLTLVILVTMPKLTLTFIISSVFNTSPDF